jgi:hypothetical protein
MLLVLIIDVYVIIRLLQYSKKLKPEISFTHIHPIQVFPIFGLIKIRYVMREFPSSSATADQ